MQPFHHTGEFEGLSLDGWISGQMGRKVDGWVDAWVGEYICRHMKQRKKDKERKDWGRQRRRRGWHDWNRRRTVPYYFYADDTILANGVQVP